MLIRVDDARTLELAGLFKYFNAHEWCGVGGRCAHDRGGHFHHLRLPRPTPSAVKATIGVGHGGALPGHGLDILAVHCRPHVSLQPAQGNGGKACTAAFRSRTGAVAVCSSFNRVGTFLESQDLDPKASRRRPAAAPAAVGKRATAITITGGGSFGWVGGSFGAPPQPDPELTQIKKAVQALDKAFEAGAITEKRHENAKAFLPAGTVPGRGEVTAFELAGIELTVESGSCVGIVVQVGSGKTSLLHAILGEMEVLAGTVEVSPFPLSLFISLHFHGLHCSACVLHSVPPQSAGA